MGRTTRQKEVHPVMTMENKLPLTGEDPAKSAERVDTLDAAVKLDAILAALVKLDTKVDLLASDFNLLRADQRKISERVKTVETEIATLCPKTKDIQSQVLELHKRVGFLEYRAENAEGRARRNKLRIMGLPETVGHNLVEYLEDWLRTAVAPEGLSAHYALERAHRVPARPPQPGMPPRPVLARLLNFRDRDLILQCARKLKTLEVENSKIMIFPDFTAAVQQQRATFIMVKRKMRELELKYALMFPAKLKVMSGGETFFFTEPEAALTWLESRFPDGAGEWNRTNPWLKGGSKRKRNRPRPRRPTRTQSKEEQRAVVEKVSDILGGGQLIAYDSASADGSTDGSATDRSSMRSVRAAERITTSQSAEEIVDTDVTD